MTTYPLCYLVNDRPVMIVRTPDGGGDCLVLDWASGSFVPDRSYFARTVPGDFADVDSVTMDQMESIVVGHRARILHQLATRLASADESDGSDVHQILGLAPGRPPFDADDMEPTAEPGLVIVAPRLLRRRHLDATLGVPELSPGPEHAVTATYRIEPGRRARCSLVAAFGSGAPTADALRIQLARIQR